MQIKRNGVAIDILESGSGDITLFFVHGSFIDKEYWKSQIEYFSPRFKVIAIDLPGHGKSGENRENWTVEEFGKDVTEVIRQLNLTDVVLIGHSMGADVILEAANASSGYVTGFIGIDHFKNAGTEFSKEIREQANLILNNLRTDFSNTSESYARMLLLTKQTPPSVTERVVRNYRRANPEMGLKSVTSIFNYWKRERELLQKLPFKLHLINCDYYPTNEEPLKMYAKSGYEITSVRCSSHFPMIEIPNEFNTALENVLAKVLQMA